MRRTLQSWGGKEYAGGKREPLVILKVPGCRNNPVVVWAGESRGRRHGCYEAKLFTTEGMQGPAEN